MQGDAMGYKVGDKVLLLSNGGYVAGPEKGDAATIKYIKDHGCKLKEISGKWEYFFTFDEFGYYYPTSPILSPETIDMIAIDSLKQHADKDMEPLQKEAFRIVLRYYGVTL